jgi:hypothetical protein
MHRPLIIALLINACWLADVYAEKSTSKLPLMPDLCQTDAAFASLPNGGKYWCGPTAVANALIAMDRCRYDNLVAGDVTSKRVQLDLLTTLGQTRYLRMRKYGIGPIAAMVGIENFVRDRGYDVTVAWQGWRHGDEFTVAHSVHPRWLREGVLGDSNVVLNVGWYKHDPAGALYSRIGGHYMTLAGYENHRKSTTWLVPRLLGKTSSASLLCTTGSGATAEVR